MASRRLPVFLGILLVGGLAAPASGAGQWARLTVEENVRSEPNGTIIGQMATGSRVRVEGSDGDWTRVTLEGAVWLSALQARGFGSFDLVVVEPGGENLRVEPRGQIVGRLGEGALLEEVSREPGWARVRRTAWIWTPSLEIEGGRGAGTQAGTRPSSPTPQGSGEPEATPSDPVAPAPSPPISPGGGGSLAGEEWIQAGPSAPEILSAPAGDTLARARSGTDLRVLTREGDWARVQLEGWVWLPGSVPVDAGTEVRSDVVVRGINPSEVASESEYYRGRLVELDLQFISVERAEPIRTDFREGEPFLLTRSVDSGGGFVYVAVPADRLPEMERLTPLARIQVVGRVRTGAAALTGSPILELMELRVQR